MKKVYIKAYLKRNLGDDLLVKILTSRYKNKFTIISRPKYKYEKEFLNIKMVNKIYYYLAKIYEIIALKLKFKNKYILEKRIIKKSDIIVRIGGSIFIEDYFSDYLDAETNLYKHNKPYFILGANFGPYKTEKYKEYIENEIIKQSSDTCFRDNYSYLLFKNNFNVRKAPDVVFNLNTNNLKIANGKKVIISVINCNQKKVKNNDLYEEKIVELIKFFIKKKYEVVLISFCKFEGDEITIKNILNRIEDSKLKNKVSKYFYRENIIEALNIIADSQIVVGTRFHANVLGLIMNKTIIPIVYSDKTLNVLKDMKFKGKIFDIRDIDNFEVNSITKEDLKYKLDISTLKKNSKKQFKELDKILERSETE